MLLTQLQESISKVGKTTEDLQKLLDASGSVGIEAISHNKAKIFDDHATLIGIITAGSLPFQLTSGALEGVSLSIQLPTLKTFHGFSLDKLSSLSIGSVVNDRKSGAVKERFPLALESLKQMPRVKDNIRIEHAAKLRTLEGLRLDAGGVLTLNLCSGLETIEHVPDGIMVKISGCENVSFKHFPKGVVGLNLEDFYFKSGLPWIVAIPKSCNLNLGSALSINVYKNGQKSSLDKGVSDRLLAIREHGAGNAKVLEAQQLLLDEGYDELSEL